MQLHILPRALACLSLACLPVAAQGELGHVDGAADSVYLGASVVRFFDIDGDGYYDYLAGQPGLPWASFQNGKVLVLSGRYLAVGSGPQVIKTLDFTGWGHAGTSLASVGDLNGDGKKDILVGLPTASSDLLGLVQFGRLVVRNAIDGSESKIDGSGVDRLGASVSIFSDINGDGVLDVLAGSPGYGAPLPPLPQVGMATIFSGAHLMANQRVELRTHFGGQAQEAFGSVLCVGKFNADSILDYAISSPHRLSSTGGADGGRVYVYDGATGGLMREIGGSTGALFGSSLDATGDVTGDGVRDLVVGAPGSSVNGAESGSVYVYSGASLAGGGFLVPYHVWHGKYAGDHFGASVQVADDINGDGTFDVLVGSPDYEIGGLGNQNGAVTCYSGTTGEYMGRSVGAAKERRGAALCAAYNVDGKPGTEFLVGSPGSSTGALSAGRVTLVSIFPNSPTTYCTAKLNSLGCLAAISSSGLPSATSPAPFLVKAASELNNSVGLLFYGYDAAAAPFQGGTLCIGGVLKRLAGQASGGTAPPTKDCSGSFSTDFSAHIQGGADASLVAGQEVFCQWWSRDVADPFGSNTTNALRFVINP